VRGFARAEAVEEIECARVSVGAEGGVGLGFLGMLGLEIENLWYVTNLESPSTCSIPLTIW
jgi:hypothetical protein